ncbi:MAG: GTPase Era [Prolixibacteraceae bacterium]|jgi:GTP-binding protein Era|nr:GTPase Era [Prolixibacteraceae bacterium]MDD4755460.1 GTPase Era [Prolixibacteraceae bacterium]NLO02179.1 GTPase Era [Bacteroidales bacterium]
MAHKAGFVNILGNPNVGKSTVMNVLVGERLSVITKKMQTTRHRIKGIVNGDDFQIVYSDTPGILKPGYKLQETMMKFVDSAILDADVILFVTDVVEKPGKNPEYIERIRNSGIPVILLINKIDISNQEEVNKLYNYWKVIFPDSDILAVSAKEKFNIGPVFDKILTLLPENPPFFEKDVLTDRNQRFFMQEIIREKILLNYRKEVPYSVEVLVEEFKENDSIINVRALIYVSRESQKGIIIGKGGSMLKKVGKEARLDAEEFFGKKIFLELFVKVAKDWRDKDRDLKNFGYEVY